MYYRKLILSMALGLFVIPAYADNIIIDLGRSNQSNNDNKINHDQGNLPGNPYPEQYRQEPQEHVILNDTVQVYPGSYYFWYVNMYAGNIYRVNFQSSGSINLFFTDEAGYMQYRNNQRFNYYSAYSHPQSYGTSFNITAPYNGRFYFIFDNKKHGTGKRISMTVTTYE